MRLLWLIGCCAACSPTDRPEPPSMVVLISLDTLRADHVSAYGYERPTTPTLDRLAQESLVFERAYSHSPKTAPSHMSLFTSVLPETHRVNNWHPGVRPLGHGLPTLAEHLRRNGWRTAAVTEGGNVRAQLGFDRGFESYEHLVGVDAIFGRAADRIDAWDGTAPLFLFVHTYEVHDPYVTTREYAERYVDPGYTGKILGLRGDYGPAGFAAPNINRVFWSSVDERAPTDRQHLRDLYDAEITRTDAALARLLARLAEHPSFERALLIVLSDHGEEFYDHRRFRHNSLYDEVLHVPLIVRLPEPAAQRITHPARLIDVAPTVVELAALAAPTTWRGETLLALTDPRAVTRPVVAQWRARGHRSLRLGDWKLINHKHDRELFFTGTDPVEAENLRAMEPDVWTQLAGLRNTLIVEAAAARPRAPDAAPAVLDAATTAELEALGYIR